MRHDDERPAGAPGDPAGRSRPAGRRRVAPLSPDERRAAIVEATLPLLIEHGTAVSTRQIAEAAGIAEGTIFRVFPDKNALLVATAIRGIRPDPDKPFLGGVDPGADLRARLIRATTLFTEGVAARAQLMIVIRQLMMNPETSPAIGAALDGHRTRTTAAMTELLEPDRHRLRVNPHQAARIVLTMIFSSTGMFGDADTLTPEEIVSVVLDGLLIPPAGAGAHSPQDDPARRVAAGDRP